jgi:hypothetical protein
MLLMQTEVARPSSRSCWPRLVLHAAEAQPIACELIPAAKVVRQHAG